MAALRGCHSGEPWATTSRIDEATWAYRTAPTTPLPVIPGFSDEYIVNSIEHAVGLRAIVLELYGTGNLPNRKASLLGEGITGLYTRREGRPCTLMGPPSAAALKRAVEKGIAVIASSQCLRGTVDLHAYELGRRLDDIGVISGCASDD